MTFSALYQRSQDHHFFSRERFFYQVDNLVIGISNHLFSRIVRISRTDTGKQQTEEVIYLGNGTYR